MTITRIGLTVATLVTALMIAHPAGAQYAPDRKPAPKTPPSQGNPPQQGGCEPSGFAKLKRNCSTNVGKCERMPDSCSRGWCCP